MSKTHYFKLIDGKFSTAAAGEVLFSVIKSKLQYHQLELLSNEERFAKDITNSKTRINELNAVREALKELLNQATLQNQSVRINCEIEVLLEDN